MFFFLNGTCKPPVISTKQGTNSLSLTRTAPLQWIGWLLLLEWGQTILQSIHQAEDGSVLWAFHFFFALEIIKIWEVFTIFALHMFIYQNLFFNVLNSLNFLFLIPFIFYCWSILVFYMFICCTLFLLCF